MVIAVVDDTLQDRTAMETMLKQYFGGRGMDFSMEMYSSAEAFLKSYGPGRYSLIFFDIYMGGMNGMEAALRVRRMDGDCHLVFFTSSTDYAVDSYKVQAAYYLMKPLNYGELCAALDRIFGRNESGERELQVELKTGIKAAVPLKKILYLECIRRMPLVHTVDSVIEAVSSFSSLADQLKQDKRFLCCNRSIYVNMDWIREAGDMDLVLKNGEHLPMRVRGRAQIKKDYLRYMLRELRENDKTV